MRDFGLLKGILRVLIIEVFHYLGSYNYELSCGEQSSLCSPVK